jgi:hypothetical protein
VLDGERRVREIAVPELLAPLDDPCATYSALGTAPTATATPAATLPSP